MIKMEKFIKLFVLILVIIFIFCGCAQFKNSDELKTAAEKDEVVSEGKSSMDEEETNSKEENDLVEEDPEYAFAVAYSEEDFIEMVKAAKREYGTQKDVEINKLNELDFYYRIVEIPEGYEFTAISANEWNVFIYYNPISAGGNQLFDYDYTLVFTMRREIDCDPQAPAMAQLVLDNGDITKTGSIYYETPDYLTMCLPEKYWSNKDIPKSYVAEKVIIE